LVPGRLLAKLAEIADQYLKKGTRVFIEGRLQVRKYTGMDGVEQSVTEIVANDPVTAGSTKRRVPASEEFDDALF
jgi:single-strand DNA-binding protein